MVNNVKVILKQQQKTKTEVWDFPGGAVIKALHSQCRGPGQGTKSHVHAATTSSHDAAKEPTCCN